ncbi:PD-(D/E)XK nuclease family protein [Serratia sp. DD3]|uniref:PDDEXK-like family protein n=1 Tax=Serratia sp. DD3 TaxID=1410619 RepID=UPI00135F18F8|nr:PD-(D/E)XK nuclease family protein [Serratia sp. DD3]
MEQWQQVRPPALFQNKPAIKPLAPGKLAAFCSLWQHYQPLAAQNALFFDPWDIAGLARKEVQNTTVLAWLLNPLGSHGFGDIMLNTLMAELSLRSAGQLPAYYGEYCRVNVEVCPSGDTSNRVDLVVDAHTFYLLVEVKIDAAEQYEQLSRYAQEANICAGQRPWAVLFLTPHGCVGSTIGESTEKNRHLSLSWYELSRLLWPVLRGYRQDIQYKSPQRHMAEQSATCFIRRMMQF